MKILFSLLFLVLSLKASLNDDYLLRYRLLLSQSVCNKTYKIIKKKKQDNKSLLKSFEFVKKQACVLAFSKDLPNFSQKKQALIKRLDNLASIYTPKYACIGNWWPCVIGIPRQIAQIIALINLPKSLKQKLLDSSKHFARLRDFDLDNKTNKKAKPYLGANLADLAFINFTLSFLSNDKKEEILANKALNKLKLLRSSGPGFYPDGGYLQHKNIPYNGTYGQVYLQAVARMLFVKNIKSSSFISLANAALKGYKLLFFLGGVNDSVSGRAISRDKTSVYSRGREVLNALFLLSLSLPKSSKTKLQNFIYKQYLANKIYENDYLFTKAAFKKEFLPKIDFSHTFLKHTFISSIKRLVYQKNFGVLISLCSDKIGCYEGMNGKNSKGFDMSLGMTYFYDDCPKCWLNYLFAMDFLHLSGTTQVQKKLGIRQAKRWLKRAKKSSNGLCLDDVCLAFISLHSKRLSFFKSFFINKDVLLASGSDIYSASSSPVHTTLKNSLNIKSNLIFSNLLGSKLISKITKNKGIFKKTIGLNKTQIAKKYSLIYLEHGVHPQGAKYLYAVSKRKVYLKEIKQLFLGKKAHLIGLGKALAFVFLAPACADKYCANQAGLVLIKNKKIKIKAKAGFILRYKNKIIALQK